MAAMQTLTDNFLRAVGKPSLDQRKQLQAALLQEGVWGLDVLESAVHLTAATLAMTIPEVMVHGMRLYTVPLGVVEKVPRLGSLDLLSNTSITPQLALYPDMNHTAVRATDAQRQPKPLQLPKFDLICMNPPFARTCEDNLLFGSLPKHERKRLKQALQRLLKKGPIAASVKAGLASVFIAVADRYLRAGGRLAFVAPKTLLSGVTWKASRQLLMQH
ncbi:MAG: hypothetical protein RMJ19_05225 [Gemmatales bacterium]|nr:hypothetical protein [Gemmatales bacterium]MDW8175054.1 hypothetical protein [Gemmatales bacterium]